MKNLVGLVLVLFFALESPAQIKKMYQQVKQAVTGSAKLGQLHYFPEQWEADVTLGYRYTVIDLKGNSAGITVLEAKQDQSLLKSSLVMGVLDNAYVQFDLDYSVAMDVSYTKPAATPSTKSKGLEDPIISAVVRLVDGNAFKLDAKGAFQPTTGDHQEADANNDGDAKSGGHAFVIGGRAVALVTNSSQLSAKVDYKLMAAQTSVDQTTNVKTEDDKHNQLLIELTTLTEITSDMFFGVMLEIANVDGYKSTNLTTNTASDYGATSGKTLNVIGKYLVTPDSLIEVQAGYLLDYTQTVGALDASATGYSLNANYTIRF